MSKKPICQLVCLSVYGNPEGGGHPRIYPQILCQDLAQLNLPVPVSTPEEFTEKGLGNTAWQARLHYLVDFL